MAYLIEEILVYEYQRCTFVGSAHVVILGAGASIASALRNPEKHGLSLPSMNDLPKVCGLDGVLSKFPEELICEVTFDLTNVGDMNGDSKLPIEDVTKLVNKVQEK